MDIGRDAVGALEALDNVRRFSSPLPHLGRDAVGALGALDIGRDAVGALEALDSMRKLLEKLAFTPVKARQAVSGTFELKSPELHD